MEFLIVTLYIIFGLANCLLAFTAVMSILKILNLYSTNLNLKSLWIITILLIVISLSGLYFLK